MGSQEEPLGELLVCNTPDLRRTESAESVSSLGSISSCASASSSQRQKIYRCEYKDCNKAFTRPSLLTEHQLAVHHGIKPHECKICGKTFSKKSHLDRHMFTHSDSKPFICSICGKGVTTRQQLKRHEVTHTKSFVCPYEGCNEAFYKHPQLRSHILSVHEKKLTCEFCHKTFQRPYRLKNHIAKHHNPLSVNKYQCDFMSCTQAFPTWSALQAHKKLEHPKIPCKLCGKLCVGEKGLQNHMIVHDKDLVARNWQCSECDDQQFAKKAQLLQHYVEHHKDKIPSDLLKNSLEDEKDDVLQTEVTPGMLQDSVPSVVRARKRNSDDLESIRNEVKVRKYIESGKSALSLLLNSVGEKRDCPYPFCNRTFKTKEKYDRHIEKHKIHDLKIKILEEQTKNKNSNEEGNR